MSSVFSRGIASTFLSWWPVLLVLGAGCVDLSRPWDDKHRDAPIAGGDGTEATGGMLGGSSGAAGDGETGGSMDAGLGGASGGTSGDVLALDGHASDAPSDSALAPVDSSDGASFFDVNSPDQPLGGAGGSSGADGDAPWDGATGGADGTAKGGSTGSGGSGSGGSGSGGSMAADAWVPACLGYRGSGGAGVGGGTGITQGLAIYYSCESSSGTALPDVSGNHKDGTLAETPSGTGGTPGYSFAAGKLGNGLVFNKASKGYVSLPAGTLAGACEITIATWVKINAAANWQRVWDFGNDDKAYMFLTSSNAETGNLRFAISNNGNASTHEQLIEAPEPLPIGVWTHVAVVLGTAGAVLYLDGVAVAQSGSLALRPADLGGMTSNYIGRSHFTKDPYLDGSIDDFRVYNRALSSAEVQALFAYTGS